MIIDEETLAHYGTPRHSGRYPWGSGGDVSARNRDFLGRYAELKNQGMAEKDIATAMGFKSTTELRNRRTIARNALDAEKMVRAQTLKDTGMSDSAIGREMGINESSVRSLLAPGRQDKNAIINGAADALRKEIGKDGILDIGAGSEHLLDISRSKFDAAVTLLKEEGYLYTWIKLDQLGTQFQTTYKVLAAPGITASQAWHRRGEIKQIQSRSEDGGRTIEPLHYPKTVSSKQVSIKWGDEGGSESDGMIFIRPGTPGLSLGHSSYAQVRINIDDTHFLKGMAMYKDDLPEGTNIEFHTNKPKSNNKFDAMKPLKKDEDGNVDFMKSVSRQKGALNIVNEEGDWDRWAKNFSSQMLSKQPTKFAKQQLDILYERKRSEFNEIMSLTNPVVRKKLLEDFADGVDASAVDLEAAGLPRTRNHVILPLSKIKPDEIYAPNYKNGEVVALVRHPHGGTFEIPNLKVNNNNPAAKKAFGPHPKDAVGIHHSVAEKLSGADFDGDTVLVIPNGKGQIKHSPTLDGLKDFDPKTRYKKYDGMRVMTEDEKQHEMGNVSNLITDMTIKGASHNEIARAIRHSMVVIDAEKHELNWKQSEIDNGIRELKQKWQGGAAKGAATIVSRAGARIDVLERKQLVKIDPATGKKIYTNTNAKFVTKDGRTIVKKQRSKKLAETDDAFTLVGDKSNLVESVYATHSNKLKALANEARKADLNTKLNNYDPSANRAYATEVASLKSKLSIAQRNAPLERQAQVIGNAMFAARLRANPNMDPKTKKKLKGQILTEARARTGAGKVRIEITPAEWNAIQAGAITNSMLRNILSNAKDDVVKELATPKQTVLMTSTKTNRAKAMLSQGYTQAEVAEAMGVSLTTLKVALKGE